MLRGTTILLLGPEARQVALRNISALVVKRGNATSQAMAAEVDWEHARPYEDMPGPKPMALVGNAFRFLPGIGDMTELMSMDFHRTLHKKYGNIMKIAGIPGKKDIVMVFDPNDVEKVFRNEGKWPIRDTVACIGHYRYVTRKDVFDGNVGLVVTQGEEWQRFRTKVNQTMMQPKSTKLYTAPIDKVASDFVQRVRDMRDAKLEMPDNFNNELFKWGLESIAYVALDTRLGCLDPNLSPDSEPQKMIDAVQVMFETMFKMEMGLPVWKIANTPAWRSFVKANDYFIDVCLKYINQATERLKALPEDSDRELTVLEKLLARDSNPKTAMVMAMDMLGAGIDTTSYSSAVALYCLAKNPDKQEKLFQELQQFVPAKDQQITSQILDEMRYLKACIKESMRILPITVGNQRELVKDLVLSGYRVPKGTNIMMPLFMLSNMDEYFPEANKFIPERWLKDGPYANTKMHSFVSLPFGFGPRMCVGRRFAELEIETLVAKMIRNFKVEYNYGDMKFKFNLLHVPASPLKFKMVDRQN